MSQRFWMELAVALSLGVGIAAAPALAHGGSHKHVCKKDDKVIKVRGKTAEAKKADCEAKGGTWEEASE